MKVLQVYNQYRSLIGGEEAVVQSTAALIEKHGGQADLFQRSSRGLDASLSGRVRACVNGVYSRRSRREVAELLRVDRPDVVHAHNLYPMISPSVLLACRDARVPVVMSLHNYVLSCPTTHHLSRNRVCERCRGGFEYRCVLSNCRENLFESAAYALRSAVARRLRLFKDNVDCFVVLSEFARGILIEEGYAEEQVEVLPNWVDSCRSPSRQDAGTYVAFAGRLRGEKGVDTLLEAARALPEIPFRLAGDGPLFEWLRKAAPPNVHFEGRLGPEEMSTFYRGARMLVVPSRWFEMSPLVVAEAMSHGLPIVASAIGALPELVEDGLTGELFAPGQARELADVVCRLWEDLPRCRRLGAAGRERAKRKLGEEVYAERLFGIYARAIERVGKA